MENNNNFYERIGTNLLLAIIILAAALMRFYNLGGESYWYDEIMTLNATAGEIKQILTGPRPQFFLIIAYGWIKIFGVSETATRSLSCVFGTFSILLIYLVARELYNKKVGIIASLIMAFSQFQIYYSQEFRYYSLFVLTTLLSFYCLIKYLKNPEGYRLILYVISNMLMYYSHYFGLFSIAAQGVFCLFLMNQKKRADYRLLSGFFLILLPVSLKIFSFMNDALSNEPTGPNWLAQTSIYDPLITLRNYIGSGLDYPSLTTIMTGLIFFLSGTVIFIKIKGISKWTESLKNTKNNFRFILVSNETLLIVLWFTFPIVIPFVISEISAPIYHYRYTMGASPAFYIIIALFLWHCRQVVPEIVSVGMFLIILIPGLMQFYNTPVREQWREAAQLVRANFSNNSDVIIFNNDYNNLNCFRWYFKDKFSTCIVNTDRGYKSFLKSMYRCSRAHDRIWFVVREAPDKLPEAVRSGLLNGENKSLSVSSVYKLTKITVYLINRKE